MANPWRAMGVWISYDLIGTDEKSEDYERLIDKIKSLGAAKRVEYSLWVVETADSPEEVRDALRDYIDDDDKLIVMRRVGGSAWRGLASDVSKWLKEHPA
jgi:hypothetical protein